MVAIYVSLGLLFLVTDVAIDTFPGYRKEIGGILLLYALIRLILQYYKIKREKDEFQN